MSVIITLLKTLHNSQLVVHLLNQLGGLNPHLDASHDPMTNLTPTNGGPTLPSIQQLKRRSVDTSMVTVVVKKTLPKEGMYPNPSKI